MIQGFKKDGGEHWFNIANDNGKIVAMDPWQGDQAERAKPIDEYLKAEPLVKFHRFTQGTRITVTDPGKSILDPANLLP